jgi:DNA (cytosine-5)-methyltransferase 1
MDCDSGATLYEFFAGGGMARLALAPRFRTIFANDLDPAKCRHYARVFGPDALRCGDVAALTPDDLPGRADLAWASFPCQDLSLAGARGGLAAPRSGAFWGFWRLIEGLAQQNRAPRLVALENVRGLLTSNGGRDFAALAGAFAGAGYRFGALEMDAAAFVPQSRPRLFLVACREPPPAAFVQPAPSAPFHSPALAAAQAAMPPEARAASLWWRLPAPPSRNAALADLIEDPVSGVCWNGPEKTARLVAMMSPRQRARLDALTRAGGRHVGALFKRIRIENGVRVQRAEVRFDGLAGCLRTPAGGSSRQTLMVVEDGRVRTRLLAPREAARLMGLDDSYPLPDSQSAALHLLGDGVATPVVRWLSEHLLAPLAAQTRQSGPRR